MSLDTSYAITLFLCWSSTGNAVVPPSACPALHLTWRATPKPSISTTHSNAIAHNHNTLAP